ncbi:hypothetical protein SAMD00024442_1_80 [Candidatus Symbiothrix dinenymphae]|nr:hypothetical protein SAMD00024442_1_80 [Candidatus Symbiothrix dinenymphae]
MYNNDEHEKMMVELRRLMGERENLTKKDLEEIVNQLSSGKTIPKSQLTPKQQAENLVLEARELASKGEMDQAGKKIEEALELNPDSIEAYELLAQYAATAERLIECLSRAIYIGMELFPEAYLMKHGGDFWSVPETRPLMRCMKMLADHYFFSGDTVKAVDFFEKMILLNKKDHQGVRFQLFPALLELGDFKKFQRYDNLYEDSGNTFALFTRALFAFKTKGKCAFSNNKLKEAMQANQYVAKLLLSNTEISTIPETYKRGDENEAQYYVKVAKSAWQKKEGALDWLRNYQIQFY